MSTPKSGHGGEDDGEDTSEAVSPEEALESLPTEEEFEAEFDE
ncbi:hypothetical protein [Halorussus ruber]|nr:hypothetical protein [Halorussus ruber]